VPEVPSLACPRQRFEWTLQFIETGTLLSKRLSILYRKLHERTDVSLMISRYKGKWLQSLKNTLGEALYEQIMEAGAA
jgi:hypothetical protein